MKLQSLLQRKINLQKKRSQYLTQQEGLQVQMDKVSEDLDKVETELEGGEGGTQRAWCGAAERGGVVGEWGRGGARGRCRRCSRWDGCRRWTWGRRGRCRGNGEQGQEEKVGQAAEEEERRLRTSVGDTDSQRGGSNCLEEGNSLEGYGSGHGRKVLVTEAKAWKKALAWKVMAIAREEEGTLLNAMSKITKVLVAMPATARIQVESVGEVFGSVKLTLWGLEPTLNEDSLERGKGGL